MVDEKKYINCNIWGASVRPSYIQDASFLRVKLTRPFRRKTKSGFCACAITFQTQSTRLPYMNTKREISFLSNAPRFPTKNCFQEGTEALSLRPFGKSIV
jgi:hypothetical protein